MIPTFITTVDQAPLLDETLSTVDAETFTEYEVIVVDDGSPVDVREVTAAHPRTITVRQENAGSAIARNTGIRRARGEFIVFLDGDDLLLARGGLWYCVVENIHDRIAAGDRARALGSARLLKGECPRRWTEMLEATGTDAGFLARDVERESVERRAS